MRKLLMPILTALLIFSAPFSANAQEQQNDENLVKIRLLGEQGNVQGGDELWIAIEKSIANHWHTYWRNPGDSGTITKAAWNLPEGFEISEIYWPTPKRLPYGPLMNYGYENNVVLLQKLKLPKTIPAGEIKLTTDIELLVCKEECIPEYGQYTLTLNGVNSQNEDNLMFFEKAISKLPIAVNWPTTFKQNDKNFKLNIELPSDIAGYIKPETLAFYPHDWGLVENAKQQSALLIDNALSFTQRKGERGHTELDTSTFVITFQDTQNKKHSYNLTATPESKSITPSPSKQSDITILKALLLALLGGLILNLMPCVFPVLSIKALSLVKISEKHPNLAKLHGISYTLGVILSFLVIAGALLILKSAGAQIGWGFQLQNPIIVGALCYLLFIIGLNMMGFFEFGNNFGNIGNKLTQGKGLSGSFFTGVLATLVATPCTAPFMAGAIGFALTQTALVNLTIFAALGLGLALPYLALSIVPALQKRLPKPGAWMNTFRQFLAFPMFAAAIWLVWVVSQQAGPTGVLQILSGMGLIGFGVWILHVTTTKKFRIFSGILFLLAASLLIMPTPQTRDSSKTINDNKDFGEAFSPLKLEALLQESENPIFVEMTAAWCITCKVNHASSININSTKQAFEDNNVEYLIGDWTNYDPEITEYLNSHGRNGVPIYVFYGAKNKATGKRPEAVVLPQILTPKTITNLF